MVGEGIGEHDRHTASRSATASTMRSAMTILIANGPRSGPQTTNLDPT
jgi:hypothetical protein